MRTVFRLAFVPLAIIFLVMAGCSNDKGPGPTPPVIQGDWPADAMGRYELTVETWTCIGINCSWAQTNQGVFDVCGNPFELTDDTSTGFFVDEEEGVISSTEINITYRGRTALPGNCTANFASIISTDETNSPPTRGGWSAIVEFTTIGCGSPTSLRSRFTYTRVGDGNCMSASASIGHFQKLLLEQLQELQRNTTK